MRCRAGREHRGSWTASSKGPLHTDESTGRCSAVVTFAETKVRASHQGPGCEAQPKRAARQPAASRPIHQRVDSAATRGGPQGICKERMGPPSPEGPSHDPHLSGRSDRETDRDAAPPAGDARTSATDGGGVGDHKDGLEPPGVNSRQAQGPSGHREAPQTGERPSPPRRGQKGGKNLEANPTTKSQQRHRPRPEVGARTESHESKWVCTPAPPSDNPDATATMASQWQGNAEKPPKQR